MKGKGVHPNEKAMPDVLLRTRPQGAVICPHCWTAQRNERSVCYRCGARFVYLDEAEPNRTAAG